MEYDVAYGVRTMEQLMALIAFFRSMKGRVTAFNYLDHVDFTSSIPTSYEARRAPAVGPFDQTVGAGDGQTTSFQLTKTYATATQSQVRPIYRPVPGTVRMGVNGKETTFFTVSAQGVVTFTSPLSVKSKGAVSIPAGQGDYTTLTGQPGDFTALKAFAASNWSVSVTGFTNTAPNVVFSQGVTVVEVATDGSWVTLCYPHSYPLLAETSAGPITITMSPAPPPNTAITAGYQFYVPVRFDTDTLPITLHEYGVGGANSVKLIEVRPTSWG